MRSLLTEKTAILKVLSDPTRYKIMEVLQSSNGNICVNDIAEKTGNTPSAISHQLAKLESAGLVHPVRKGQQICYILQDSVQVDIMNKIMKLLNNKNILRG